MSTFCPLLKKIIGGVLFLLPLHIQNLAAQKIETPTFQTETNADGSAPHWSGNASLGLDAAGIQLINPRLSEGESRINAGGVFNFCEIGRAHV